MNVGRQRKKEAALLTPGMPTLLTTEAAAAYLGLAANTLAKKRHFGTGPVFCYLGKGGAIRYRVSDLDAWLIEATSTSEAAA